MVRRLELRHSWGRITRLRMFIFRTGGSPLAHNVSMGNNCQAVFSILRRSQSAMAPKMVFLDAQALGRGADGGEEALGVAGVAGRRLEVGHLLGPEAVELQH